MKPFIAWFLAMGILASAVVCAEPALDADGVTGIWWSPKMDSKIKFYQREGKYYGKIIWMLPKDMGNVDFKNPDPKLRGTKILGLELFRDFKFDGKKTWKGGFVYDPRSGKTYHAFLQLKEPDLLRVKGYIGVKLLGRSAWFRRVK